MVIDLQLPGVVTGIAFRDKGPSQRKLTKTARGIHAASTWNTVRCSMTSGRAQRKRPEVRALLRPAVLELRRSGSERQEPCDVGHERFV